MLDNFPDNYRRSDEEVLNEFRQKQINFDLEERKNEMNNSRGLFIGALAGLAMAGIVGWFVLAPQYQGSKSEDVPLITRQQTPVKIQPSEPGDIELASQERTVYDIIEKRPEEQENEKVVSSAETPDAKKIEQLVEEASIAVVTEEKTESLAVTETPKAEAVVSKVEEKVVDRAPKAEAVKPEPVAAEKAPAVIKAGSWQVQLISSPNKPAVEKAWGTLSKKYPLIKDLPYEISSADLKDRGVFYRLKAGSFESKESAVEFCNKLKSQGGSCVVTKK